MAADDYAVVIGINRYKGFPHLSGAEFDATGFAKWLQDQNGGNVPPANIKVLLSSQVNTTFEPWETHVKNAFVPLENQAVADRQGRAGRRLYIFFAGHGFNDPVNVDSAALYTADAEFNNPSHASGTGYAEHFRRSKSFDEIVLIMDCCRSVSCVTRAIEPSFNQRTNSQSPRRVRIFYALATEWGYDSRERVIGGTMRGIFSTAFLDALENALADPHGDVMGKSVKDYVHSRVSEIVGAAEFDPPEIRQDDKRDICFTKRKAPREFTVRITLDPFAVGMKLRLGRSDGKPAEEIEATIETASFLRLPGLYKAEVPGENRFAIFEVIGSDVDETI